jgi:uncharacterized membrane protein YcaP (DUF421 family)
MNPILRALFIYLFLLVVFRLSGKRTLSQTTTFEFVMLLIVGEATQQALLGEDFSITNAFIVITTLIGADILLSKIRQKSKLFDEITEGLPLVIVDNGKPLYDRMQKTRVDEQDILEAARIKHGLERMDQIKYAVLERDGKISIIPAEQA